MRNSKRIDGVLQKCLSVGLAAVLAASFTVTTTIAYADENPAESTPMIDAPNDNEAEPDINTPLADIGEDVPNDEAEGASVHELTAQAVLEEDAIAQAASDETVTTQPAQGEETAQSNPDEKTTLQSADQQRENVSISVSQNADGIGSDGNAPLVVVAGDNLKDGAYTAYLYYKATSSSSFNSKSKPLSEGTATFSGYPALSGGRSYELYAVLYKDGTEIARSETATISAIKPSIGGGDVSSSPSITGLNTGSITLTGGFSTVAYYPYGGSINDAILVSGSTISGLAAGDYYVFVPAFSEGNTYYLKSSSRRVTVGETDGPNHLVTLAPAVGAKWSGNGGNASFSIKQTGSKSIFVKPADEGRYYISGITVNPAENASMTFSATTGEVFVENVTGDVTLTPEVTEKAVPTSLAVTSVRFNEGGVYDEGNASVQVSFSVEVKDQFGSPIPGVTVYFKENEGDVSATQARTSSAEGAATFKYSYGIAEGDDTADYNALFSLSRAFAADDAVVQRAIHLVQNRKVDLVLYADQIIGTAPGSNDGKVVDVPAGYEIWTGEVHQGALVIGTGSWVASTDGTFSGLSAGQHLLRNGERVDTETNTFYFASDPADFFIPRGIWTASVDTAQSRNVTFAGITEQKVEPGGTAYFPVSPDDGAKIASYFVDKPNYVNALRYDEGAGNIVLEGVSGSVVLTVIAEQKPAASRDSESVTDIATAGGLTTPAPAEPAEGLGGKGPAATAAPEPKTPSENANPTTDQDAKEAADIADPTTNANEAHTSALIETSRYPDMTSYDSASEASYAVEPITRANGGSSTRHQTVSKIADTKNPAAAAPATKVTNDNRNDDDGIPLGLLIPIGIAAVLAVAVFSLKRALRSRR